MMMIVSSRSFTSKVDGQDSPMLIPGADLLDHRPVSKTDWYYDDSVKSMIIAAKEDIAIGEEIFLSYGCYSNVDYLINYGFMNNTEPYGELVIRLSLNSTTPGSKTKCALLHPRWRSQQFVIRAHLEDSEM